jgi:hypothetical protein
LAGLIAIAIAAPPGHRRRLLFVVCAATSVVLLAATACSVIDRFALALVLTCIASLALACHALPQTGPAARAGRLMS